METTKKCTKCGEEKPLDQFGNLKASKDGKMPFCSVCNKSRNTNWRNVAKKTIDSPKEETPMVDIDWTLEPIFTHEVKRGNDVVIGDFFKNVERRGNFILKIVEWDIDNDGKKEIISNHLLFVPHLQWERLLSFSGVGTMKSELSGVADIAWKPFVEKYTNMFTNELPENPLSLRFKKHGSSGKEVRCGFSLKHVGKLKEMFPGR